MGKHLGTTVDVNGNVVRRWMGSYAAQTQGSERVQKIKKDETAASAKGMVDFILDKLSPPKREESEDFKKGWKNTVDKAQWASAGSPFYGIEGTAAVDLAHKFFERELRIAVQDFDGGSYDHMESNSEGRMDYLKGRIAAGEAALDSFSESLPLEDKMTAYRRARAIALPSHKRIKLAEATSDSDEIDVLASDVDSNVLYRLASNPNITKAAAEKLSESNWGDVRRALKANRSVPRSIRLRTKG